MLFKANAQNTATHIIVLYFQGEQKHLVLVQESQKAFTSLCFFFFSSSSITIILIFLFCGQLECIFWSKSHSVLLLPVLYALIT